MWASVTRWTDPDGVGRIEAKLPAGSTFMAKAVSYYSKNDEIGIRWAFSDKITFEKIICLKSWGIFINEEEEIKKAEKEQELKEKKDFEPENQFFLP